ncbi:nicotinate-nucleotide diphosphorylase (carboxylating) [Nitrospira sp.]|nr:nicotinate-nucleotide diphosphorylase (carboxylating) [Nitrospira sp.]
MPTATSAPSQEHISHLVRLALFEDLPSGDLTTSTLFPSPIRATGTILAKQTLTVAGVPLAEEAFRQVDAGLTFVRNCADGQTAQPGDAILTVTGDGRSILSGERVALNFLQHLSGIATLTARFCEAVKAYHVIILDTRKTTPGLRTLQKWAVRVGGGSNHRLSLSDGILIKDNHLLLASHLGQSLTECCRLAKNRGGFQTHVIVEADSLEQIPPALEGRADIILLDNMPPAMVRRAIDLIGGRAQTEVSGGITLANVADYAALGPTYISIGALTHSAPAVDIGLDLTV